MGTTYQVKYIPRPKGRGPENIKVGIDSVLREVNRQMSTYLPDSEISKFNRSESLEPIPVSEEFHYVVSRSLFWTEKTRGAFDVTVFPLLFLWGFGPGGKGLPKTFPDSSAIFKRLSHVGSRKLVVQGNSLRKLDEFISIDLNAIAKGFGVDAVYKYLISNEISNLMIEIGGEVRTKGRNPLSKLWTIAIERPTLSGEVGEEFNWRQTSYNGNFRKQFAGPGFKYDKVNDVFVSQQPSEGDVVYASWTLDSNYDWHQPTAHPDDGKSYGWNEDTKSWKINELDGKG